jgi:hypothetical protein
MYEMGIRKLGDVQNSFRLVSYTPLDTVRSRSVSYNRPTGNGYQIARDPKKKPASAGALNP